MDQLIKVINTQTLGCVSPWEGDGEGMSSKEEEKPQLAQWCTKPLLPP